jgi:Lanthionine synthetase C-like protein
MIAAATTPTRQTAGWHEDLYAGAPGIALLHIEQAHAGVGSWDAAHAWAVTMVAQPVTGDPNIAGLHRGAPAVAFALHAAGQLGYSPVLSVLDGHITDLVHHRLRLAQQRIDTGRLPALREYDLISGLTGVGAYLLHRGNTDLLKPVLAYLVRLTEPVPIDGSTVPGWWTANAPNDRPAQQWPGGHANLGMAHGIAVISGVKTILACECRFRQLRHVRHDQAGPTRASLPTSSTTDGETVVARWVRWLARQGLGGSMFPPVHQDRFGWVLSGPQRQAARVLGRRPATATPIRSVAYSMSL